MSYDPIESASKGVAQGFLIWGEDFIKRVASKFKDKQLAFIQDEETIKRVKEQYKSGELAIYKEYIQDKEILLLLQMGLTLRGLEKGGELERRKSLREKIFNKYKVKGLHIAQFAENGILNRYIGILIDGITSIEKFKEEIMEILKNIEKYVLFVKADNSERFILDSCLRITTSNLSMIFIVSGMGSAVEIIKSVEMKLVALLRDYELEKMSKGDNENLFFKRILI